METDQPRPETEKKKKKCHGNRKLYHFKRKCRSRGMTEEQITVLINTRNNDENQGNDAGSPVGLPSRYQLEQKKQRKRMNKRKRAERNDEQTNQMNKSMSQLSVSQQSRPKKLKAKEEEGTIASTIHSNLM
jgi:DNA-binding transcriptional MerR regulator